MKMQTYDLKAADLVSSTWTPIKTNLPNIWSLVEVRNEQGDLRQAIRVDGDCYIISDENLSVNLLVLMTTLARKQTQGNFIITEWRYL